MPNKNFYANVEAFKRGMFEDITYYDKFIQQYVELSPKQVAALRLLTNDSTKYVGYGGAARGGKSLLICLFILLSQEAYPGTRYLLGRYELTNLIKTTWVTMLKLMDNFGFDSKEDYTHNKQNNVVDFHGTGSQILLYDTKFKPSDPLSTRFGSLEITHAIIDESNETSIGIIDKCAERVGNCCNLKYNIKGKVFECFNPDKNHVNRRYWIPFRDDVETTNKRFVRALPSDNPSPEVKRWLSGKIQDYKSGDMSESHYQRIILGNFDYDADPTKLIEHDSWVDSFNNAVTPDGTKCLTADIAGRGSDSFVIKVWFGRVLMDIRIIDKSGGKEVVDAIKDMAKQWGVKESEIVYDADGLGGFVGGKGGFLPDAKPFINNSRPDVVKKYNYKSLKAMCAFKFAENVNNGNYYFHALRNNGEVQDRFTLEAGQLKRVDEADDKKPQDIVSKKEMKENLGFSPDLLDASLMREYLYLPKAGGTLSEVEYGVASTKKFGKPDEMMDIKRPNKIKTSPMKGYS